MSRYVILGGTGTLGKEITRQLLAEEPDTRIVIFSRDELKQQQMKREFQGPGLRFVIGDVRDREAVRQVLLMYDVVFLLAAMKHIDCAEQNPLEALKTNVLGAVNVAEEAMREYSSHVVFSNTDKAVLPITTYGYTKAIAQNYLLSLNGRSTPRFSAFAWGNILASRGSVVSAFAESLKNEGKIRITDMRMSRFWLSIEQAASFMLANFRTAPEDRAMVPPVKAATVIRVATTIASMLGVKDYEVEVVGMRGTEKLYEVLESTHEGCLRSDTCEQYTDLELRQLLKAALPKTLEAQCPAS